MHDGPKQGIPAFAALPEARNIYGTNPNNLWPSRSSQNIGPTTIVKTIKCILKLSNYSNLYRMYSTVNRTLPNKTEHFFTCSAF